MQSFLDEVVSYLLAKPKKDYASLIVVLPSQRAGLFLKKKLVNNLGAETIILPQIISIEEFIAQQSGMLLLDTTEGILLFYEAYLSVHKDEEKQDFDSFSAWGQTLLQDFNEIDRYLVDHDKFFNYLYYINDQKHWFLQENKTNLIENYIEFWQRLQEYYKAFVNLLKENGKGYQGLQYRSAAEGIEAFSKKTKNKYLFVGFNALNTAEQHIFKTLEKENKAAVIWDADAFFLNDTDHDASHFLRSYKINWKEDIEKWAHQSYNKPKALYVTGVPKNIGQVKYIAQLLEEFPVDQLSKTAIILADENLLVPMLNSLPGNVQNVNITMGLSLSQVPISAFFEQLFLVKESNTIKGFYYKNVLALLRHSATEKLVGTDVVEKLIKNIINNNWVYINLEMLNSLIDKKFQPVIGLLFTSWSSNTKFIDQILVLIDHLGENYTEVNDTIHIAYVKRFEKVFLELKDLMNDYTCIQNLKTCKQLYKQKVSSETIDFRGEPFQGLQIMGVLESRCLDFEHVIFTSVNEGTLPSGNKTQSFIPFDVKIDTGLPTFKEKDAIYAYHFYRAVQRVKTAHLIYNTEVDELNSGEKSRFLQQIELEPHPNHTIFSSVITTSSEANFTPITQIDKDESVLGILKKIAKKGFSPSALGLYLRDPLTFYERYILGVGDAEQVEEEVAANTLGTVIHNVLENFYHPLVGKNLVKQDVVVMQKQVVTAVEKEFEKVYSTSQITSGINFITVQAAIQFINKFLQEELKLINSDNEIHIVAIEENIQTPIQVPGLDFPVSIRGKVDRVDRFNGQLRIVDYKTGFVDLAHLKIKDWEVLSTEDKYSKALQVLMYAYMYCENNKITIPVTGGIISFKKLNKGFLGFSSLDATKKFNPEITSETFDLFLTQLHKLISEICDVNSPFIEKAQKAVFSK